MNPPVTPHTPPANGAPKPRSRRGETAGTAPDQPATKPKRQADEGERTRPPVPEIDGRISRAVADARRLNGLTQEQLAARMGVSSYVFGRLERGQVAWLVQQVVTAARALGVYPAELLVAAGLSETPGMSPEQVISRDPRLPPFRRAVLLEQYADAVSRSDRAGGL